MKYIPPGVQALIATGHFRSADLYEIKLISGTVIRVTTADYDILYAGNLYTSSGPLMDRTSIKQSIGSSVDSLTCNLYPKPTDLVDGIPFLQAIKQGAFDGATLLISHAFMPSPGNVSAGVVKRFGGRFGPIDADRSSAEITVDSWAELLNVQWPFCLYGPGCKLTLFSPGCGLDRASYTFTGTVDAGSTLSALNTIGLSSKADGYFDTGVCSLSGGSVRRAIKTWSGNTAKLATPLYTIPNVGDSISLTAGCDKSEATCLSKFNNKAMFQGEPHIPDPETAV
jgi:uncharacterized phage protein (TIGR02218 family)